MNTSKRSLGPEDEPIKPTKPAKTNCERSLSVLKTDFSAPVRSTAYAWKIPNSIPSTANTPPTRSRRDESRIGCTDLFYQRCKDLRKCVAASDQDMPKTPGILDSNSEARPRLQRQAHHRPSPSTLGGSRAQSQPQRNQLQQAHERGHGRLYLQTSHPPLSSDPHTTSPFVNFMEALHFTAAALIRFVSVARTSESVFNEILRKHDEQKSRVGYTDPFCQRRTIASTYTTAPKTAGYWNKFPSTKGNESGG